MKLKIIQKAGRALKKATPTILTCIGGIGVVATTVLAVKATPKAIDLIQEDSRKNHDGDPNAATKTEVVKSCWKCYIPAAATGVTTVACILGANILNRRQQASLASAYAVVSRSYTNYKQSVKDLYGKEAHKKVLQHMDIKKAEPSRISAPSLLTDACLDFEDAKEEERLFYDPFSQRYFTSTIGQILQAEYHLNRNFALEGGCIGVNDFYRFLGIEPVERFKDFGWWVDDDLYWIDFDHVKTTVDDGLNGEIECYIIDMIFTPTNKAPD